MPEQLETEKYSLADQLKTLGAGRFDEEATQAVRELVRAMTRVAETSGGKPKGQIVITLKLQLDRGVFDMDPAIKVTTPATQRARTIFYAMPDGRLSKHDHRQTELALSGARDVSTADDRPIRVV
jgi:hypothetical protein